MTRHVVTVCMDDSLKRVRELFAQSGFHHLLVVDKGKLVGVISDRDLLKHVSPFVGHELSERTQDLATLNRRVHQIMSRQLVTCQAITDAAEAARMMLENRISCLPVVDETGRPVGIVTCRDLLRRLVMGDEAA